MTDSETSPGGKGTKERILDAAEALFAEQGIGATSLRAVIAKAGVNLAAVHYHFGSKEELVRAVVSRRIGPMNRERLELLSRYEAESSDGAAPLDRVVDAFLRPMMSMFEQNKAVASKLVGRMLGEPGFLEHIAPTEFRETRERFLAAFRRAAPHVSEEEMFWRLMCCVGVTTYCMRVADFLPALSGGAAGPADMETAIARVAAFLEAGIQARPAGD